MRIITFAATEPNAHGGQGLALILDGGQTLPIVIRGTTPEAAGETAARWLEAERERLAERKPRGGKKAKAKGEAPAEPAAALAALTPVIDDEECV